MNICRLLLAVALTLLSGASSFAWNETGHRAIALLAFEHMTPETKARVAELLARHPHADSLLRDGLLAGASDPAVIFANAAKWPDEIRAPLYAKAYHRATWHYVNIPYVPDEYAKVINRAKLKEAGDLLRAIDANLAVLRDGKASKADQAIALCWVAHLIGDVHQPLHVVALYTPLLSKGDKGGNLLLVRKTTDAKSVTSLHIIWDDILGGGSTLSAAQNIVSRLKAEYPNLTQLPGIPEHATPRSWAEESMIVAKTHAYLNGKLRFLVQPKDEKPAADEVPALPDGYLINGRGQADMRAAQAAYRLATALKDVLAK